MGFAEKLKRLRRERFWSQGELARRSGVARQTIYRYEAGLTAPYGRTVRALAEAFGVEPQQLATLDEVAEGKRPRPEDGSDLPLGRGSEAPG